MSQYWICDTCGEKIQNSEDGWVEWIVVRSGNDRKGRNLRLVHSKPASSIETYEGCQFNEKFEFSKDQGIVGDLPLDDFLGSNGLIRLLAFISEDELPKEDVLEMIKRLFIPGYEVARLHFDHAIHEGVFEPNMPKNYYWVNEIEATLAFAKKQSG